MSRKLFKTFNVCLILIILSSLFISNIKVNAETNQETAIKGDLRCPQGSTSCTENKDEFGNVTSVNMVVGNLEQGGVQIVKVVEKTEVLGRYKIYFNVRGNNVNQQKTAGDVYVYVIFDISATMNKADSVAGAQNAIKTFARTLVGNTDGVKYYFAGVQFATNVSYIRYSFTNQNFDTNASFCSYNTCGMLTQSQVNKAYQAASTAFNNVPVDAQKYVVLFGDGRYYNGPGSPVFQDSTDTNWSNTVYYRDQLINKGVKIYGIRYPGSYLGDTFGNKRGECTHQSRAFCDELFMVYAIGGNWGNYFYANAVSDYTNKFLEVAGKIEGSVDNVTTTLTSELIDNIGSEFYLLENSNGELKKSYTKYKRFDIGAITTKGVTTEPIYIEINPYAKSGWYQTNNNFHFQYTNKEGEVVTINSLENPEVYWVQQSLEIDSCSGVSTFDSVSSVGNNDEYSYYSKICNEGYLKDNTYYNGFSTTVKINNLELSNETIKHTTFSVGGGFGFPIDISLSTNLMCQYKFLANEFIKDYTDITKKLQKAKDKELATLTKQKQKLDTILNNYIKSTSEASNDLENYKKRFEELSANLTVTYDNSSEIGGGTFVNVGEINATNLEDRCTVITKEVINGQEVITSLNCFLSLSKEMQLKSACLDMQSGEQVTCTQNNTQLNGGNKFYTLFKQKSGNVFVEIKNAGYSGLLNIKTKNCSFTKGDMKITYRPIELTDPFLQNYDNERKVGKNYLNTKYNFVNIIKPDIWNEPNTSMYQYDLSKTNIKNIKKDTSEEGVNSYLGRNCYFNANNQYICDLTRNKNGLETNWFTNFKFPK